MDPRRVFDDLVRVETVLWNSIDASLLRDCGISLGILNLMMVMNAKAPAPRAGRSRRARDHRRRREPGRGQARGGRLVRAATQPGRPALVRPRTCTEAGEAMLLRAGSVFDEGSSSGFSRTRSPRP